MSFTPFALQQSTAKRVTGVIIRATPKGCNKYHQIRQDFPVVKPSKIAREKTKEEKEGLFCRRNSYGFFRVFPLFLSSRKRKIH
jgi:hypothetical protein